MRNSKRHFLGIEVKNFSDDKRCYLSGFRYVANRLHKGISLLPEVIFEDDSDKLSALSWEDRVLKFDDNSKNRDLLERLAEDLNNIAINKDAESNMYRITIMYEVEEVKVGTKLEVR